MKKIGYIREDGLGRGLFATEPRFENEKWVPVFDGKMSDDEKHLRRMLCVVHCVGSAYMDDGEAQCNAVHPFIDFLRDSVDEIEAKLFQRGLNKWKDRQNRPFIHVIGRELWLCVYDEKGTVKPLDGPEPLPEVWVEKLKK